jgi:predicted alpha/beta-hydrolase family hydrolase
LVILEMKIILTQVASDASQRVEISVNQATRVSGMLLNPPQSKACFVVAHGAGAGMQHPFMVTLAHDLAALRIATLRYQFPYMEKQGKRPDPPALCHATVRAAVAAAQSMVPSLPLIAGGKSFGGRMTSQAQAASPLPEVRGLVFLGFPLHPPKEPSDSRAEHLSRVRIPMLFLQGTRDEFAELARLDAITERLGAGTTLFLLQSADHSFHVPARSGRTDKQTMGEMLVALTAWIEALVQGR